VTVALSGDGGDELFGGYETYFAGQVLERFQRLPRWVQAVARRTVDALPVSHGKISLEQKLKRFMALSGWPPLVAHARWRAIFWAAELPDLLVDGLADPLTEADAARLLVGDLRALPDPAVEGINALGWLDTRHYLPADMLVKVDRVTMAHSLEARVPLLDERLVDFGFRLHPRLKWRGRPRPPCTCQGRVQRPDAGMDSGAAAGAVPRRADVHSSAPGRPSSCQFCGASLRRARRAAS